MITHKRLGNNGRLGNQLFQIAATIGTAIRNRDVAVFPPWSYADWFKHPITIQNIDAPTYQEPYFAFRDIGYTGDLNLEGYFQSEKYFVFCKDLIRWYFEPKNTERIKAKYGNVLSSKICSIHVRRGDYITADDYFFHCDLSYYQQGINHIPADYFLVFSDDIPWCKNAFHIFKQNFIFVEDNADIEDLFLMSMCNHHIMANSSFSWWGSWLNRSEDKIIVAPKKWFGPKYSHDTKDLYTSNMTLC
jgi:hypothetical protein